MKSEHIGYLIIIGLIIGFIAFIISIFDFILYIVKGLFIILATLLAIVIPLLLLFYLILLVIDDCDRFYLFIQIKRGRRLNNKNLTRLKELLLSRFSILSIFFNKSFLFALFSHKTPNLIRVLSEVISKSNNPQLNRIILEKLSEITEKSCIDQVCKVWVNTRHQDLTNLLVKKSWVASAPVDVKVLTALKTNQLDVIINSGEEIIKSLLNAFQDKDFEIANRASECAIVFDRYEFQDSLCHLVIEQDHPIARQVAIKAKYAPHKPIQKALFYLLTEQWDKYESLDFDQTLLRKAHELANEQLRKRITEKLRQAGRVEWLKVISNQNQTKQLGAMTDAEWETTLAILESNRQWEAIWRLAQKAPAVWSKQLLNNLKQEVWLPTLEEERIGFERLKQLANKCSEKKWATYRCQGTLTSHTSYVKSITFSPDGKLLASCSLDETIRLWRIPDGYPLATLTGHTRPIHCVTFSPDGKLLASCSLDETIRLWRIPDGYPLATLTGHTDAVTGISFSPDGKLLASCSEYKDKTIRLWQMPNGHPLATLTSRTKGVDRITFSPDGKLLASCTDSSGYGGGGDTTIRLWEMPDGYPLATLTGHTDAVTGISFSPDGKLLVSCSEDKTIRLWKMPDGYPLATLTGHTDVVRGISFSPDGQLLASYSSDKTIRLWQMPNGHPLATLEDDSITGITFSPDGKLLASYDWFFDWIALWQMPDGYRSGHLFGHTKGVSRVTFSPDGKLLASCSSDKTIKLWSSDVVQLSYLPIQKLSQQNRERIQKILLDQEITEEERNWLEFMQALIDWYQRFDVEVEDAPQLISTGEFDIEIEG